MENKYSGLSDSEVLYNQKLYGLNIKNIKKIINCILYIIKYPTFLMFLICSIIYFILGKIICGSLFLCISIIFIINLIYTKLKISKIKGLLKLNEFKKCQVIRNNKKIVIDSKDLTIDDIILFNEGEKIYADSIILESNNLYVDESILCATNNNVKNSTALLDKNSTLKSNYLYDGSIILSGSGVAKVIRIGDKTLFSNANCEIKVENNNTYFKKIQKKYNIFINVSIIVILSIGIISSIINNLSYGIIFSMISGISCVPILTPLIYELLIYKKMYNLEKKNLVARNIETFEALSKISYMYIDKIGLLFEDNMEINNIYSSLEDTEAILNCILASNRKTNNLIDRAIYNYANENNILIDNDYKLIKTYPLSSKNKMMANVYDYNGDLYIYVKGDLNSLFDICILDVEEKYKLHNFQKQLHKKQLADMKAVY